QVQFGRFDFVEPATEADVSGSRVDPFVLPYEPPLVVLPRPGVDFAGERFGELPAVRGVDAGFPPAVRQPLDAHGSPTPSSPSVAARAVRRLGLWPGHIPRG